MFCFYKLNSFYWILNTVFKNIMVNITAINIEIPILIVVIIDTPTNDVNKVRYKNDSIIIMK